MDIKIDSIVATHIESAIKLFSVLFTPLRGDNRFDERLSRILAKPSAYNVSSLKFGYKGFRGGNGEIEDTKTYLEFLKQRHGTIGILGYSYGSVLASNIAELCNFAVYVSSLKFVANIKFKNSKVPKLFIITAKDQVVPLC